MYLTEEQLIINYSHSTGLMPSVNNIVYQDVLIHNSESYPILTINLFIATTSSISLRGVIMVVQSQSQKKIETPASAYQASLWFL
jgi:hypothetical protein